ncbi:MobV family relaxase [Microbacteriaceae bacterium 4G12]
MAYAIMRHKKHKMTGGGLKSALMHLYREQETPNADPSVSNLWFTNDGEQTTKAALTRLHAELGRVNESRGRKLRKDAVVAVEYVMTASPEWFSNDPKERANQAKQMSIEARKWLQETYPDGKIIAAQIHMDETTPHLSIFVTPTHKLNDDRLSLSAREWLGDREKLQKQQDSFAARMKPLGLERGIRGSQANHEKVNRFYGRLKAFEGEKSELVEKYRTEIDKIDSKILGGKAELVELAKLMAEDLAILQSNYKRTIADQSKEAEARRMKQVREDYEGEIHDLKRDLEEANKGLKATSEELEFTKKKNALYNEGIVAVDDWRDTLKGEQVEIINSYVDVMNYEVGIRMYEAGISTERPPNPYTKGPKIGY